MTTRAEQDMRSWDVLGVRVMAIDMEQAVAACLEALSSPAQTPKILTFVNPHSLVEARRDPRVLRALCDSDLRFADGVGIVLAGHILGQRFPERVAGPDLFPALAQRVRAGTRYFFYGSTPAVLEKISGKMRERWPHVTVCGTLSPPFRALSQDEELAHCEEINAAAPDVLWVGLTAPKQELWAQRNRARLRVPLVGCIGAAFDYISDNKQRSSPWFRRAGLEWLPRLVLEPRRLWRRTVISTPLFLWYTLGQAVRGEMSAEDEDA